MNYQGLKRAAGRRATAGLLLVCLLVGMLAAPAAVFAEDRWASIETSYYENSKISVSLSDNIMTVTVPDTSDYTYIAVSVLDEQLQTPINVSAVSTVGGKALYRLVSRQDGIYYIQLYKSPIPFGSFRSVLYGRYSIALEFKDGSISIAPSDVYKSFREYFDGKSSGINALYHYLQPTKLAQSNSEKIQALAAEITAGVDGAYAKARAIYNWISTNIYYDYDGVLLYREGEGIRWAMDAVGTLDQMASVCEGIANLYTALLQACGIPAQTIYGCNLTSDDDKWLLEYQDGLTANHAWTEMFLNGRWVMADATLATYNMLYEGEYQKDDNSSLYFDTTPEFFSYSHMQTRADTYDPEWILLRLTDVDKDAWYYNYVQFVVNYSFMRGYGGGIFDPDGTLTQAMFVTMLSNMAGSGVENSTVGPWFESYMRWAQRNGLLKGINKIDPDGAITREEMAIMLDNYVHFQNIHMDAVEAPVYTDLDDVSAQGRKAVEELSSWGVLEGRGEGIFDPYVTLKRSESAKVITIVLDATLRNYLAT